MTAEHSMCEELQCYSRQFYENGIVCVVEGGRSVLIMKETGKMISTLLDVPMIYAYFLIIVSTVLQKIWRYHYHTASHNKKKHTTL